MIAPYTKNQVIEQVKELKEPKNTVEALTTGINNALVEVFFSWRTDDISIHCFKEHHSNKGNAYKVWIEVHGYDRRASHHRFSKEIIKETIENFRKAGRDIKTKGNFSQFGWWSFTIHKDSSSR